MRALVLIAQDEALFGHDLELFQDGGVLGRPAPGDGFVDFANRCRSAAPQDGEDFEFGVGGTRQVLR